MTRIPRLLRRAAFALHRDGNITVRDGDIEVYARFHPDHIAPKLIPQVVRSHFISAPGHIGGAAEHLLPAGGYIVFPAGTPHRLWTTEETVLQMSGIGPRTYVYLGPAEDPRAMP